MNIDRRDALAGIVAMFGASLFAPIARAATGDVTPIDTGPPSAAVFTPQQREMGDAIMTASALVREAIPLLSSINTNAARINVLTENISQIEGHADELHDLGMHELYLGNQPANAMAFFVGAEIYDHLEKVADRFDDVANEIQGIVLENV